MVSGQEYIEKVWSVLPSNGNGLWPHHTSRRGSKREGERVSEWRRGGGVLECCASHWEVPMWLSMCWAWKKGNETLKAEAASSVHGNQFVVKLKFGGIKLFYFLQTIGIFVYIKCSCFYME